jgi:hypothetical protein
MTKKGEDWITGGMLTDRPMEVVTMKGVPPVNKRNTKADRLKGTKNI